MTLVPTLMRILMARVLTACLVLVLGTGLWTGLSGGAAWAELVAIRPYLGDYVGTATVVGDGDQTKRDLSVSISATKEGFTVEWTSVSHRADGEVRSKEYSVTFEPTGRGKVFAAAMQRNVFGHAVQLDPMAGEPYVWARIQGATLTVFSMFVDENGDYEMQQFDRTLTEGGLNLDFKNVRNGEVQREITAFLKRQ